MSESSTQYHNPPGFAKRILGFLLKDPIHETPLGDFEEFYNWIAEEKGVFSASIWYWTQVLNLLRKKMSYSIQRSIEMLKSYFKTAFRNMLSHKIFSLINIFGLSLGISVCLLIFSYVRFEFSFDRFHENSDNIYRVLREVTRPDRPVRIVSGTSCPMRDLFIETYPEIQYVSRIVDETSTIIMNDNFFDHTIHYVDPEFLKLFSYNILNGDRNEPLKDLNSVVITQSMAAKFFDNEDPIGKEIIFDLNDEKIVSHVTAVIEDPPLNSSIRFEFLIPFMKLKETWGEDWFETYGANSPETYLMLVDNTDRAIFEEKMGIAADIITKEIYTRDDTKLKLYLQPLKDIYLESDISQNVAKTTNPVYSYILSLLCALLLLIACVNYILLSVGRSAGRAREIGVRKVLGAFKKQLVKQYLGEAMFVSMLALIFGFMLASLMLPTFNELSGRDISLNIEPLYIMFGILIMLTVGIIAGSYPALLLSSFKPVSVLKSSLKIGVNNVFGKGLIILQFSITIFLLSTAFIMRDQLDFMLNKDLGYDSSHIAMVDLQVEGDGAEEFFGLLKNELSGNKDIVKISAQSGTFGRQWTRIGFRDPQGKLYDFAINTVDYDYLKTMDIKLIQGRDFSREFGTDKENSIIVNQAFVDYFGFENPLE
ncbi:MAG: FtsX-like permease family protein, partial [bacterium]|nr:FtsX-like permease family protein [bacterium]